MMMTGRIFEFWLANLDPSYGTEAGKTRPVLIVQTNSLNKFHHSTLVCPITTHIKPNSRILRVHISKGTAGVKEDCDVMIDQLRAIDNKRFIKKIGDVPKAIADKVKENLKIVLEFEE
jgi:mRNA interferase MazF